MTNTITKITLGGDDYKVGEGYTAGTGIVIDSDNEISVDTTVIPVQTDLNTKTFYLSSTSDLTTAQAAYDWYLAGKNPIIMYDNTTYILKSVSANSVEFKSLKTSLNTRSDGTSHSSVAYVNFILNNSTTITSIADGYVSISGPYIATDINYSNPYIPQYDGNPATKKYVDDNVVQKGSTAPASPSEGMLWYDTTNDQLKVYDGTNWNVTGKEYNAGEGIEIKNGPDYSAMQGPAPDGFHVPLDSEWVALCGVLTTTFGLASNATTMGTYLKMPMAGYRITDASVSGVGSYGRYRSSTPYNTSTYSLRFDSSSISPQGDGSRAGGFSVRCFKDEPAIPTSSWTTLYDGSSVASGAGVFYNATDGLISVSGDGTTWYTIQDKNLGATVVYNQGDTETDANCGYFYQWGNNYGFAHSGTLTTSSTLVDASNYGPGNYYSSDTFITIISSPYDWSSIQNDNLWGGVTGVVTNAIANTGVTSVNGNTGAVTVAETEIVYATQAEYNALPSSKLTDGKHYVIYTSDSPTPPSPLPAEYQEVEWIGSSGSQRIDTGVRPDDTTYGFECKLKFTTLSGDWNVMNLGGTGTDNYRYGWGGWNSSDFQFGNPMLSSPSNLDINYTLDTTTEHITKYNYNGNLSFERDNTVLTSQLQAGSYTYNVNWNIFCQAYGSGSYVRYGRFNLYYMKIYHGTTLIRDFVPCYRKLDNVIGLYDLVNDVFYTNDGSGTFTKGPDAN